MMLRYNNFKKITSNKLISRSIFNYKDAFLLEKQLSDDEKSIRNLAHNFSKDYLLPNVVSSFRNEKFDKNINVVYLDLSNQYYVLHRKQDHQSLHLI